MKTFLTSVSSPVWGDDEHTFIDCFITTSQFGNEKLPFTASPLDPELHGRKIFEDLVAGKYGEIAEFVPKEDPNQIPQTEL